MVVVKLSLFSKQVPVRAAVEVEHPGSSSIGPPSHGRASRCWWVTPSSPCYYCPSFLREASPSTLAWVGQFNVFKLFNELGVKEMEKLRQAAGSFPQYRRALSEAMEQKCTGANGHR